MLEKNLGFIKKLGKDYQKKILNFSAMQDIIIKHYQH